MYHNPVLLDVSTDGLRINSSGTYVDATFGGGGHTRSILARLTNGRVIAFDQDREALENMIDDPRLILVHGNFRYLTHFLRYHNALPADGILADLGVSSHQIDRYERGFSTRSDAPLDMRMDPDQGRSAAELLNTIPREELETILREYGELPDSRRIATAITRKREQQAIASARDLKEAVKPFIPPAREHKFLAKLFQALRIAVNEETEALKEMLTQSASVLKPGGRLVVISYHSIEDRLVKHFIRSGNFEDKPEKDFFGKTKLPFTVITRKAISPTPEEIASNNRARSARLRIGEKN